MLVKDAAGKLRDVERYLGDGRTMPAQNHHLRATGSALMGLSVFSAGGAWLHMHALGAAGGPICGAAAAPHCVLCPLSLALLATGLASLAAACPPATGQVGARR